MYRMEISMAATTLQQRKGSSIQKFLVKEKINQNKKKKKRKDHKRIALRGIIIKHRGSTENEGT